MVMFCLSRVCWLAEFLRREDGGLMGGIGGVCSGGGEGPPSSKTYLLISQQ